MGPRALDRSLWLARLSDLILDRSTRAAIHASRPCAYLGCPERGHEELDRFMSFTHPCDVAQPGLSTILTVSVSASAAAGSTASRGTIGINRAPRRF
jgi:hypothetical protein